MTQAVSIDSQLTTAYLERLKSDSANEIRDETADLTTRLYAIHHLNSAIRQNPALVDSDTIFILRDIIKNSRLAAKRQSLFFFRIAAETLCSVMIECRERHLSDLAFSALKNVMAAATGYGHRAATEALTTLPVSVRGPDLRSAAAQPVPGVTWQQILVETGFNNAGQPTAYGRSIVVEIGGGRSAPQQLLVVKLVPGDDDPSQLLTEACWIDHFNQTPYSFGLRFNIPKMIKIKHSNLVTLTRLPPNISLNGSLPRPAYAICFTAARDYYKYPNDANPAFRPDIAEFKEITFRNAWLMGKLASVGVVHLAPIPLFHNRVQVNRRRDRGVYEWYRGGRLDRWLDSCNFPNLGASGIRDFEHLISFQGSNLALYRHIGNHFLSLMLIAGSYFRNKAPEMVGFSAEGKPMDTRFLFDINFLEEIIRGVFHCYYEAFVGSTYADNLPIDTVELAERMVEEMGVDTYMEETLRALDQDEMTDDEFKSFLKSRINGGQAFKDVVKGLKDIRVYTGPHLGGFNQQISLPELIESVATMSALCIAGKFRKADHRPPG